MVENSPLAENDFQQACMATNIGSLCPEVTNFSSPNFGYQLWFCTRLINMLSLSICNHCGNQSVNISLNDMNFYSSPILRNGKFFLRRE